MFTSPFPDVEIPNLSVFDHLFGSLEVASANHIALVDGATRETTTYGELVRQIEAVAGALDARGIGVGSVVALHSPNRSAFAVAFHGILRAGATATTVNALSTAGEMATQLADSKAVAIIAADTLFAVSAEAADLAGVAADNIISIGEVSGSTSLADLIVEAHPAPEVHFDPATHLAVLPYSSGTTGKAKGVMLTHRNLVANVAQSAPIIGVSADDRVLAVLPFFHIYGMTVLLNISLAQRSTLVTMARFDLTDFLSLIQSERITYVFIAPPIAVALAKHPLVSEFDLSSLRTVFSGAAPLDGIVGGAVAVRLNCEVLQGYGMTEMSPVSHASPRGRTDIPLNSVGLTVPNVQCRIVDPLTGDDIEIPAVGVSEPGELLCRGPNIMVGYLGNDEATRATIDADGFLHTGDIATVSAEGYVTVVDRLKELIKYKGYQVAPAELESLLLGHPQIADAAVIGVIDADGEEVPKAFLRLQPEATLTGEEIMMWVADRVAPHKKVRQVEMIDFIPKSASGKILRKDLRSKGALV
ncbi:4-coumarate--CoA ligase family protein [Cryobacterium sp. TMS1-20-1]|uniref:AMP-binding protein n=1 Tax=Cryobacterium sp. TMS1-20-1 TaxID=1259223 RepID=UPI00106B19D3|nr:AMP-binding protein [Cryobacterium sp. TMS1-20-1]TFC72042.1 4-coumarate--CoA ligase family protein [Cryobacterium sp. TMS1-20-1]